MTSPPCSPLPYEGDEVTCARGMSQSAARKAAKLGYVPLRRLPGESGWGALCEDCIDELPRIAGDVRAVMAEWRDD
jgi:hypothetical protein